MVLTPAGEPVPQVWGGPSPHALLELNSSLSHSISLWMSSFLLAFAQLKKQEYTSLCLNSLDQWSRWFKFSPMMHFFCMREIQFVRICFLACVNTTLPNNTALSAWNDTFRRLTHSTQVSPCQHYHRLLVLTVPLPSEVTWLHNTSFPSEPKWSLDWISLVDENKSVFHWGTFRFK